MQTLGDSVRLRFTPVGGESSLRSPAYHRDAFLSITQPWHCCLTTVRRRVPTAADRKLKGGPWWTAVQMPHAQYCALAVAGPVRRRRRGVAFK